MAIFESFLGVSTPRHGLILIVLCVNSKDNIMKKLLSFGKNMATLG